MFIRSKTVGGRTYYQVVQGWREGGRVRHRTIASLGRSPTIELALDAAESQREAARLERDGATKPRWTRRPTEKLDRLIASRDAKVELLTGLASGASIAEPTARRRRRPEVTASARPAAVPAVEVPDWRAMIENASDDQRESYEERAAILEYDAGLDRPEAEYRAYRLVFGPPTLGPNTTVETWTDAA